MLRPFLAFLIAGMAMAVAAEPMAMAAIPAGGLRARLQELAPEARTRALKTLGLRPGLLADHDHLLVTSQGRLRFDNCLPFAAARTAQAAQAVPARTTAAAPVAIANPPAYSSRPGSPRVLYLDFNGHVVTGTSWNTEPDVNEVSLNTVAFSLDGDRTTFNDQEQEAIRLIWSRVAEDFRPFDINVTTVEPAVFGPLTGRALITRSTDADGKECPAFDAGGVAYLGVFGEADYLDASPAWIYQDNLANAEDIIADVVSHEFGHNLGLSHDRRTSEDYYTGHGSPLSWGPIMGAPYGQMITQWSRGEFALSANPEVDLAIIAADLSLIADDHGDLADAASLPSFVAGPGGTRDVAAGTGGVISTQNDSDLFRFMADAGAVTFTITPFSVTSTPAVETPGTNLDVQADILDEAGVAITGLTSDPVNDPVASISGTLPQAGVYHLRIRGAGNLDPRTTGFSTYASIGSYAVTGNVPAAISGTISFSAATLSQNEGSTTRTILLTVQRSFDATGGTSVDYATADLTGIAGTDYDAASGTLVWLAGDTDAQTIAITVHGDAIDEPDSAFTVTLSNPTNDNALGLAPSITVTLRNDDAPSGSSDGSSGGGGGGGCSAGTALSLLLVAGLGLIRRRQR